MIDVVWMAIAFAAVIAIGIGLDRLSRKPPPPVRPQITDAPTGVVQASVAPVEVALSGIARRERAKRAKRALCPACSHRNKQLRCRAAIKTVSGRIMKCSCTNGFHKPRKAA